VLGVALSEPGLGVLGRLPLAGAGARLTYEVYAVNGFGAGVIDADAAGTRIPAGRGNIEDNNASPAFVGRVAWSPQEALEVGLSAHYGAWNDFRREGMVVEERRDLTLGVVDVAVDIAGFRLTGEAARAHIEVAQSLEGIYATAQRGFFLDIVREFGTGLVATMPASYFAAKARLEAVDFDTDIAGDDVAQLALGLNFRPTRDTAIKLDWVRGRTLDRFRNRADHAALLFSLATYF
jgi:hypothetical protein